MKNIAVGFLTILLSAPPSVLAQRLDDVLPKNHGGMLQPFMEGTFDPGQPTDVSQDFISWAMGTDVRSTSLLTDRPSRIQQDSVSHVMVTFSPSTTSPYWPSFYFSTVSAAVSQSSSDWTCGSDGDIASKPIHEQMKTMSNDTDTCSVTFPIFVSELNTDGQDREGYDTMRYWYIPHCYPIANAGETAGALDGSAQIGVVMTTVDSLLNFRSFVLHCLTLRNDNDWFCSFVADLVGTYTDSNSIYNIDYRADRAILQYLMNNPRCAAGYSGDSTEYWQLLITQYDIWQDTARGKAVFDSTVPTMQELGLDSVLIINGQAGVTYAMPTPQIIMSASVIENPFQNSTSILVSIGREAYVTIVVYNLLGVQVAGASYAGVFEQGSRIIPLDMTNAPPGAYYIRISTANNETQTLKLTKE